MFVTTIVTSFVTAPVTQKHSIQIRMSAKHCALIQNFNLLYASVCAKVLTNNSQVHRIFLPTVPCIQASVLNPVW